MLREFFLHLTPWELPFDVMGDKSDYWRDKFRTDSYSQTLYLTGKMDLSAFQSTEVASDNGYR